MQDNAANSRVGSTGIALPPVIFGTSALGNLYQALGDDVKQEIVSQWFEQSPGRVAVDSAGKYGAGLALESLAQSLSTLGVKPEDVVISNKLGWRRVELTTLEPTFEPGAWVDLKFDAVQDISYDGILRCWEQGCELLSPYRPQMVSVHDPDEYLAAATDSADRQRRWDDVIAAYTALRELREQGEVAAIGVGSKDWRISEQLAQQCDLDWVMLATSLTIYSHPSELLDFVGALESRGVSVINSAVFNAGFLTGGDFFDYRKITGESEEDRALLAWRETFMNLCEEHGVRPAEACVAFGMSPPGVVSTALNSSRPARIKQNVALVNARPDNPFWKALKDAGLIEADYPYVGIV